MKSKMLNVISSVLFMLVGALNVIDGFRLDRTIRFVIGGCFLLIGVINLVNMGAQE